ncbi:MAG: nitrous oxide reductase accessory protein NosL [Myxococcota bacterium]
MRVLALLLLCACGGDERARCERCGMFVDTDARWSVAAAGAGYDSPKCALRARGADADLGFVAYYSGDVRPGAELRFVVDSDLRGPMGADLVPVEPEQVEHFIEDHGGRAIEFAAINASVLEGL